MFYSGGWDGSCTISGNLADQFTGTVMHASCKNDAGVYVSTSLDLSEYPCALINTTAFPNYDKKILLSEMSMVT